MRAGDRVDQPVERWSLLTRAGVRARVRAARSARDLAPAARGTCSTSAALTWSGVHSGCASSSSATAPETTAVGHRGAAGAEVVAVDDALRAQLRRTALPRRERRDDVRAGREHLGLGDAGLRACRARTTAASSSSSGSAVPLVVRRADGDHVRVVAGRVGDGVLGRRPRCRRRRRPRGPSSQAASAAAASGSVAGDSATERRQREVDDADAELLGVVDGELDAVDRVQRRRAALVVGDLHGDQARVGRDADVALAPVAARG